MTGVLLHRAVIVLGLAALGCAAPPGPPVEPPPVCEEGWADCDGLAANGCERHLTIDGAHCGDCDHPCAADEICFRSTCELAARVGPM
jgi:hypothetical protein